MADTDTDIGNPGVGAGPHIARWVIQHDGQESSFQMALDPGEAAQKTILEHHQSRQLYEPDVSRLMISVLRPGDVVVDAGANCGFFTLLAAALVGPGGHVVTIEASPECAARIRANVDINKLTHVSVVESVATAEVGQATFYLNSDNSGGNALWDPATFPGNEKTQANPKPISVPATTLDAECRRRAVAPPKLIKVDTEGAEQRVLEGALNLLAGRQVPFIVAELHEFGLNKLGCSQEGLRGMMEGLGYSTFGLYFSGLIPKLIPRGSQIRSPFLINVLFSTPEKVAEYWPTAVVDPRNPG